ncbi:MAG: substrate-binding domain-containing protein, partial [Clostridiales bacterium]|nr:substrate-binding domain-containing protein [Clostridiales bacterium]
MRKIVTLLLAALIVLTLVPAMAEETITLGVVYKQTGNPFFEAAVRGFDEASKELGFEFIHNGPADSSNEGQIQIIEGYIQQEVDAIAISANDAAGVVSVLQTAMDKGIKVISWDSAVNPEGRNLNIDPSVAENIGRVQIEEISKQIGGAGQIAILSAGATMDNQNTWIEYMKKELE